MIFTQDLILKIVAISLLADMFFPEIEEVGFSLDSIPGLGSLLCHFAVSPPRSRPPPHGSLDLVEMNEMSSWTFV